MLFLSRWVPCQMLCVSPQLQEACRGRLFGSPHAVQPFIVVLSISAPTVRAAVDTSRVPPDTLQARANTTQLSLHSVSHQKVGNIHPASRHLNLNEVCIQSKNCCSTYCTPHFPCRLFVYTIQFKGDKILYLFTLLFTRRLT